MAHVPTSTWLQIHGNYLYTVASQGDVEEIERVARTMPEQHHYHHSYLHFNLAVAALALSRPY